MQAGFTLIEILAAAVLITLVAIGTLSVFESGANLLSEARLKTEAALLAQSTLEEIIDSASSFSGYLALTGGSITVPEDYALSKRSPQVDYTVEELSEYYKKVTLSVSWQMGEEEMSEEFTTLLFNPSYWE